MLREKSNEVLEKLRKRGMIKKLLPFMKKYYPDEWLSELRFLNIMEEGGGLDYLREHDPAQWLLELKALHKLEEGGGLDYLK